MSSTFQVLEDTVACKWFRSGFLHPSIPADSSSRGTASTAGALNLTFFELPPPLPLRESTSSSAKYEISHHPPHIFHNNHPSCPDDHIWPSHRSCTHRHASTSTCIMHSSTCTHRDYMHTTHMHSHMNTTSMHTCFFRMASCFFRIASHQGLQHHRIDYCLGVE
jgi:hypothetical protein